MSLWHPRKLCLGHCLQADDQKEIDQHRNPYRYGQGKHIDLRQQIKALIRQKGRRPHGCRCQERTQKGFVDLLPVAQIMSDGNLIEHA